jgi:hypothetical protein
VSQLAPRTAPASPIRTVRSTLLLSSRTSLVASGYFAEYESHLDPAARTELDGIIAGTWLPIALVTAHYAACDALKLTRQAQTGLGRTNGERLGGTLLGTLAKLARNTGTTPITLVEQFPRFWGRIFEGGGIAYEARGPKDIEVIASASPLLRSTHFRNGLAGIVESILALVCERIFIRITDYKEGPATATYLVQWV